MLLPKATSASRYNTRWVGGAALITSPKGPHWTAAP